MRYATGEALRTALEARLCERARGEGQDIGRLRKQVVFERLLCRLAQAAPDGWLLKGGCALDLRLSGRARATRDIDVEWGLPEAAAFDALDAAAALDVGDYFEFRIQHVEAGSDSTGHGQRLRAVARLAGRTFERVFVDVGWATDPLLPPERLPLPSPLGFAGVEPTSIPTIALEQHVAEKLHAYTRRYAGGRPSSRVKDLVDMVLIAGIARCEAEVLDGGMRRLFQARATHELPPSLPCPPAEWSEPHAALARGVGVVEELDAAHRAAAAFLDPLLAGEARGRWEPERQRWNGGL